MGSPAGRHGQEARGAPGEERVEHALEAVGLALGDLVEGQRRVDDAVEHHGPDVGREQRGVGEPEQRAVGLPHVGQPPSPSAWRSRSMSRATSTVPT